MPVILQIKIIVLLILFINFIYRMIQFSLKTNKKAFSADEKYQFYCTSCKKKYELNGIEAKEKVKYAPTVRVNRDVKYKFTCPQCGQKAFQVKIYDFDHVKAQGLVNVQADRGTINGALENLPELLLKGILPIMVGMFLFNIL